MTGWLGLPVAASAHAGELDFVMALVHWLMLLLFVGWSAFFVYTLVRFRRGRNPTADPVGVTRHYSTWIEVGVGICEAVLLTAFSIPFWATRVAARPPHEALVVRVVAEQYAWNVHYPGPDGEFGRAEIALVSPSNPLGLDRGSDHAADDIVSINELVLPVDRPVVVQLTSKDVIHSFGLPNFRVKQDAIPGLMTPVWFVPTRTGQYEIACSQLCGLGHYRMRGFVRVEARDGFERWIATRSPAAQAHLDSAGAALPSPESRGPSNRRR